MDRLTGRNEEGYVYRTNCEISDRDAWSKLADYEDTGLTAEEIEDFKAWLNEDREDLNDITIFNDLSELMKYRKTGVRPEEIFKLKQELENWKRESISDKAKLGEVRIWFQPIGITLEEVLEDVKK